MASPGPHRPGAAPEASATAVSLGGHGGQPVVGAAEDAAVVAEAVRRAGTSFYWAMRLLPPVKRNAMFAVYAFCREVDDIADDLAPVASKRAGLAGWRREIAELYAGRASRPVTRALMRAIQGFDLRQEDFLAVIDGMEMDAVDQVRIGTMQELLLYCDRVACAVGRLSVRIFGVPQPEGDHLAASQGEALQLTNILRDIKEDAERDRLYLPADLLQQSGVADTTDAALVLRHQRSIVSVCEQLAAIAHERFDQAMRVLRSCDRRQVRPALIMMEVYHRTFERLMRRGWNRWAEPVSLPPAEKLWVALRYGVM
jgi:phytoene synthase